MCIVRNLEWIGMDVQIANGSVKIVNGSVKIANESVQIVNASVEITNGSMQISNLLVLHLTLRQSRIWQ